MNKEESVPGITPGPWEFGGSPVNVETNRAFQDWRRDIVGALEPHKGNSRLVICTIINADSPQGKANAKAILQVPELLKALGDCITEDGASGLKEGLGRMKRRILAINQIARDALAKTKGD
jgi:hypothetical protein